MNILLPNQRFIEAHMLASTTYRQLYNYGNNSAVWYANSAHLPDGYNFNRMNIKKVAIDLKLNLKVLSPANFKTIFFSPISLKNYLCNFLIEFILLNSRRDVEKRWKNKILSLTDNDENYSIFTSSFNSPLGRSFKATKKKSYLVEVQHGLLDQSYFPIEADIFYAISNESYRICINNDDKNKIRLLDEIIGFPMGTIELIDARSINKVILYSKNPGGGCSLKYLKKLESLSLRFAKKINADFILMPHPRDNILKQIYRHGFKYWSFKSFNTKYNKSKSPTLIISSCSTALISQTKVGDYCLNINPESEDNIRDSMYSWIPGCSFQDLQKKDYINVFIRKHI